MLVNPFRSPIIAAISTFAGVYGAGGSALNGVLLIDGYKVFVDGYVIDFL